MRVADAVGAALAELGVEYVFGVVGSGNFHVTDALVRRGVGFVSARHEGGAATMADAYARVSGGVGVASVHQGCGLTNALTGLAEAAKSRTPLLVLAADTTTGDIRSNFNVDQDGLAAAVGAAAERIHRPGSAVADAARAYRRAVVERRTVVLNLPLDVGAAEISADAATVPEGSRLRGPVPSDESVAELADLVARARRPVFIAGRGARVSGAAAVLEEAAEAGGALLATSAVAKGLFAGSPWSLDVSGGFASPLAAELIAGADLVVGWGCALNAWTTRHGRLIGDGARVAQVDLEPDAIGAHLPVQLGVLGDVSATAAALTAELGRLGHAGAGYRDPQLRARIAAEVRWRDVPYDDAGVDPEREAGPVTGGAAGAQARAEAASTAMTTETSPEAAPEPGAEASPVPGPGSPSPYAEGARIDPRTLTIGLDDLLPVERVVAVDSGNFMGYPSMFLSVPDDDGFCFTQGFQSIGLGLATAVGAALAREDRLPVAALGDGGAMMGIAELDTVVRLGLPMVVVVYNDAAYGAEAHHFGPEGFSVETVSFPETDIAEIARGFGCSALTVRRPADVDALRTWLDGPRERPMVIDAKVVSDRGAWWLEEAFRAH